MRNAIRLPMALALALGASPVFALGFGQIQVKSNLNEPLLAEIPILSASPAEVAELSVRLASKEAFARIGLDRPSAALLGDLDFEIVTAADGSALVRIRSGGRVNEPFISLLLEAEWARGKLLREYTMLLDPPVMARGEPAQVVPLAEAPVAPAEITESPLDAPPPIDAPAVQTSTSVPRFVAGESYGPVGDGQALWNIALETRPDSGVNVNQMMLALLRANPDAFINGNINRLRKGAVLRIPSREDIVSVSAAQAAMQVREQSGSVGGSTSTVQPADSTVSLTAASPAVERADSRLALVPPSGSNDSGSAQSGASAQGGGAELRAELSRSQEQVETLDQENSELRSRVQELEKIREDSERLLSMRDSEFQALQQRLAELEAQRVEAEANTIAADTTNPETTKDAPIEPAAVSPAISDAPQSDTTPLTDVAAETSEPTSETAAEAAASTEEPNAAAQETTVAETSAPAIAETSEPAAAEQAPAVVAPPAQPVATAWYQNYAVLGGGAAVLLALIALIARRKRGSAAATVASRLDVSTLGLPGSDEDPAGDASDAMSDRENALLQQLAEQPDDLERHLELVRYYYEQSDSQHFEGAAEAMYAQVYDSEDPAWQQTLTMGRDLLPDHPLFVIYGGPSIVSSSEADDVGSVDQSEIATAEVSFPEDLIERDAAVGFTADQPLSFAEAPSSASAFDDSELSLQADASLDELSSGLDMDQEALEFGDRLRSAELTLGSIDLSDATLEVPDFDRGSPASSGYASASPQVPEASEDLGIDLGNEDAAATKLELARAYLDMGDVEGARGMLEEVTGEGNAAQRSEARTLLDSIR